MAEKSFGATVTGDTVVRKFSPGAGEPADRAAEGGGAPGGGGAAARGGLGREPRSATHANLDTSGTEDGSSQFLG